MKALQITKYGEIKESLSFNEVEKPFIKPKDILVEVKAASLNSIDYKLAEGKLKDMVSVGNYPVATEDLENHFPEFWKYYTAYAYSWDSEKDIPRFMHN